MKVLVTGGAGYIGSHACKAPAEVGLDPITYDKLVTRPDWPACLGPLEIGDLGGTEAAKADGRVLRSHARR